MGNLTKEQIAGILLCIYGITASAGLWVAVGIILVILGDDDD